MTKEEAFLKAAQELTDEAHQIHEDGGKLNDNHIIALALTNKDRYDLMVQMKEGS